ncbi:MAG: hypothetical protein AAGG53_04600, partial [Cyanobacteria bacterium P01_H01_bin.152]
QLFPASLNRGINWGSETDGKMLALRYRWPVIYFFDDDSIHPQNQPHPFFRSHPQLFASGFCLICLIGA